MPEQLTENYTVRVTPTMKKKLREMEINQVAMAHLRRQVRPVCQGQGRKVLLA